MSIRPDAASAAVPPFSLTILSASILSASILALTCAAPAARAQTQTQTDRTETLPGVVVTATRAPAQIDDLIADVTVLDGDSARSSLALTERLRFGGGLQLSSTGGPAATGGLLIRGANAGHTLTLIDGFRVSSASLGQTTFEALPLAHSQRIELLRGPASSLYGADALGGVVQLLTAPARPGLRAFGEAAAGGERTRQLRAGLSGGDGAVTGSVRVSRDRSDGFDATSPGNFAHDPDRDGYRRDGVSARIDARIAPRTRLRGVALQNRLQSRYDDGAFPDARVEAKTDLLGLTAIHELDALTTVEARIGRTTDRSDSISSFPGVFESRLMQYGVSALRQFGESLQAQLLFERLEETVESTAYPADGGAERTTNSVGLILSAQTGPHRAQLGARIDHSDQFSTQHHVTLAYGYRLDAGLRLGASFATGFHAPGFNDLYFPGYGRPGIRPERARSAEIGAYWQQPGTSAAGWHGKTVLFQSRVRDLITYAPVCPDPDPQFAFGCADNVDRARITGLSLGIGHRPGRDSARDRSGFGWSTDIDFLDPRNVTTDKRLPRRATRQLTAGADYGIGALTVGADLLTASRRYDDAANRRALGGYLVLNLRAAYRFAPDWEAFASLFNAGDRPYVTAYQYRQQGRLALVGVRYDTR